ncbi:MAG: cytochrome C [Deltaproteobacteria bacterium]|nr:cytochrome C [Deltaproteobacteria bacterium]
MNYPVWEVLGLGGGTLIAFISVLHVYIAHLAVGGGLFIWLTDVKGFRENNPLIHEYVRKHTWFFLLLTMVFGGVSGVGIWFIIALVNPAGTSVLIHYFVFAWAIEWVFFLGEIVALLLYHYKFSDLQKKERLTLAFLYFLFAWLSLVAVNGILAFMLTPGKWLETHAFWDGYLNATFLPSMFFRTCMAFMIAGLFGYLTTVFQKDSRFRTTMMRYCTKWLLYPLPGLVVSGIWYYSATPFSVRHTAFSVNPETALFYQLFMILTVVLFIFGLLLALKWGVGVQRALSFFLVLIGLFWMGGFEYSREIARKPFVIHGFMYSNMARKSSVEKLNREGFLQHARWTTIKEVDPENTLPGGHDLFLLQCLSCHTVGGLHNDVVSRTRDFTELGVEALLTGQGNVQQYMPPFMGTEKEKGALAAYVSRTFHNKGPARQADGQHLEKGEQKIPPFDKDTDEYVLLAWNDLGMHCISDSDPWFVILPPGNTLEAVLIRRGETPDLVSEGVELAYAVEDGYRNPAAHLGFWKYTESYFGKKIKENIGLHGNGLAGKFGYNNDRSAFIAEGIPVAPYKDDGSYNPYPVFTVAAKDPETGKVLATTRVVAPVSTEMGCRNCHEGGWRMKGVAGIDATTSTNILAVHDHLEGTSLLKQARQGRPKLCQSCHADAVLGSPGKEGPLNFSAAMHGWHANYMPYDDARSCVLCHPAKRQGNTRCARGFHNTIGMTCVNCHGNMQEHGLALLKAEKTKSRSKRLMAHLRPVHVGSVEKINPRIPWVQEPDCLTCHQDFRAPKGSPNAFNHWNQEFSGLYRIRVGEGGIRCEACHGSPHALYPAQNPYMKNRDNMQPMQYAGFPYPIGSNRTCAVCHTVEMEDSIHHENMEHDFRNAQPVP